MEKRIQVLASMLFTILLSLTVFNSLAEANEPFEFRNGIRFEMSENEIKMVEEENKECSPEDWQNMHVESWKILHTTGFYIRLGESTAHLGYAFIEDKMEIAYYNLFGTINDINVQQEYEYLKRAYAQVYGEAEEGDKAKVLPVVNKLDPSANEDNISDILQWTKGNVEIYTFTVKDQPVFIYTNPEYDYTTQALDDKETIYNTTGI